MATPNIILAGQMQMESFLNNPTFAWKGELWACIPNSYIDAVKNDMAGFNSNGDFRMTVRLNQFTPNLYPDTNDIITYLGQDFIIKQIKKTPHGVFWVYICEVASIGK